MLNYQPHTVTMHISADDQTKFSANLQQTMQRCMYTNRMRVAPRRISELAKHELVVLQQFFADRCVASVSEHGRHLAHEGLGLQSIVNLASTLRLTYWEMATPDSNIVALFPLIEEYTVALLEGFMTTYEQELCHEQQRTHDAYVRSLGSN